MGAAMTDWTESNDIYRDIGTTISKLKHVMHLKIWTIFCFERRTFSTSLTNPICSFLCV